MNKNNYLFRVIWQKQYIGISIDKILKNNKTCSITTFFFGQEKMDGNY